MEGALAQEERQAVGQFSAEAQPESQALDGGREVVLVNAGGSEGVHVDLGRPCGSAQRA